MSHDATKGCTHLVGAGDHLDKKAFTLVELLVVIAIIALLSTLVIFSVSKVVSSSRSAACTSNLRQIGAALQLFAADYNGCYILRPDVNMFTQYSSPQWYVLLQPYIQKKSQFSAEKTVLKCPSDSRKNALCSYGINVNSSANLARELIPLASLVGAPSKIIYCGDSGQYPYVSWDISWKGSNSITRSGNSEYRHLGKSRNQTVPYKSAQEVKDQQGSANFLFFDGHVETLRDNQLTREHFFGQ